MAIDGISNNSPFGIVGSISAVRPSSERQGHRPAEPVEFDKDPRAAFDAELSSMLDENGAAAQGGSGVGATQRPALSRTGEAAATPNENAARPDTYTPQRPAPVITYNASGRLNGASAAAPVATSAGGDSLASQPTAVPIGADSPAQDNGQDKKQDAATSGSVESGSTAKTPGELSRAEEEQVRKLQQRDAEVRTHEQAHQATGGEHAGGVSYTYQRGPDNRQYAVGGSVPIDTAPVPDDPEATVQKAERVRAAAMAPASPSGQDQQVAAKASQVAAKARTEQAEENLNPEKDEDGKTGGVISGKADTEKKDADKLSDPESQTDPDKAAAAGITSLAAPAEPRRPDMAESITNAAAKNGMAVSGAAQTSGATALNAPRPAEAAQTTDRTEANTSGQNARFSSAALATQAAFGTMNSLHSLQNAQEASSQTSSPQNLNRIMHRATAAYARVRGETALAPLNTGLSMAV